MFSDVWHQMNLTLTLHGHSDGRRLSACQTEGEHELTPPTGSIWFIESPNKKSNNIMLGNWTSEHDGSVNVFMFMFLK